MDFFFDSIKALIFSFGVPKKCDVIDATWYKVGDYEFNIRQPRQSEYFVELNKDISYVFEEAVRVDQYKSIEEF